MSTENIKYKSEEKSGVFFEIAHKKDENIDEIRMTIGDRSYPIETVQLDQADATPDGLKIMDGEELKGHIQKLYPEKISEEALPSTLKYIQNSELKESAEQRTLKEIFNTLFIDEYKDYMRGVDLDKDRAQGFLDRLAEKLEKESTFFKYDASKCSYSGKSLPLDDFFHKSYTSKDRKDVTFNVNSTGDIVHDELNLFDLYEEYYREMALTVGDTKCHVSYNSTGRTHYDGSGYCDARIVPEELMSQHLHNMFPTPKLNKEELDKVLGLIQSTRNLGPEKDKIGYNIPDYVRCAVVKTLFLKEEPLLKNEFAQDYAKIEHKRRENIQIKQIKSDYEIQEERQARIKAEQEAITAREEAIKAREEAIKAKQRAKIDKLKKVLGIKAAQEAAHQVQEAAHQVKKTFKNFKTNLAGSQKDTTMDK